MIEEVGEENEREYADVIEVDLWQMMEEIDEDPNAIDRILEEARRNRQRQRNR